MPSHQNSRLGQILISKGLIDHAQLDTAISLQLRNGKRLGETLVELGMLTERQLQRALKKQNNLRLAATLVAALLSPFQLASADIQRVQSSVSASSRQDAHRGLQPLSDGEMSSINAQGLDETLQSLFLRAESGDGVASVKQLAKLVMPVLNSLEAETSMTDVHYDTTAVMPQVNADGSVNVRLPSSIGELRFDNIRVAGANAQQNLGDLALSNIDLSKASLKISLRQ